MAVRRLQFGEELEKNLRKGMSYSQAMQTATKRAKVRERGGPGFPALTRQQIKRWQRIRRWRKGLRRKKRS